MIMVQALLVAGVPAAEIRCYPLDPRAVYTVRVSLTEPTTCVFPGPLKALVGANVSGKPEDHPGILLAHEAGQEYFSLRSLQSEARGALNVLYRGQVFALAFVTAEEPDRAVVFLEEAPGEAGPPARTPESLRALLAVAKQLGRKHAPGGMTPKFECTEPGTVTPYRSFNAVVEQVVRFEAEDVLVLRVRLQNLSEVAVPYDPAALAVKVGRDFFPASITEASGAIPPAGTSVAYLVVTGGATGRTNLSARETFNVIVPHP